MLEIKLKLLDNQEQSFRICLIGEGVIPRIKLVTPQIRQHGIALLNFPVTCLGSISSKPIRFKNISSVKSIVTLDVLQPKCEERPVFWLNASENCEHMLMIGSNGKLYTAKVGTTPLCISIQYRHNQLRFQNTRIHA